VLDVRRERLQRRVRRRAEASRRARGAINLKMRQSLSDWEQAFVKEISLDRRRRAELRQTAEQRALKRRIARTHRRGSIRFTLLVLTLIATAVLVTVVMFRTLYWLLG
jgi:hypothetical protein